jgi:hypothetical protein
MTNHWKAPLLVCFFWWIAPFGGNAQTPPDNSIPVMLMPFVGDDAAISGQFHNRVIRAMQTMETYTPRQFDAGKFPAARDLPPDAPPEPALLGDSLYVVTGEYYVDVESMRHFQLWLWESASGALTYTDEMVFENLEEADSYLPPLVSWVFSQISPVAEEVAASSEPVPESEPVSEAESVSEAEPMSESESVSESEPEIETEADKSVSTRRLYLGLRGGASLNTYRSQASGDYVSGISQDLGAEAALMLEFRVFRFLSFQGEAIFDYDMFDLGRSISTQNDHITDRFTAMFLRFPLLIKLPLGTGASIPAIFAGASFIMPLGKMNIRYDDETTASSEVGITLPVSIVAGIELSFSLGPGEIFAQLRYEQDLGDTFMPEKKGGRYVRSEVGLSLGYKFILWPRR